MLPPALLFVPTWENRFSSREFLSQNLFVCGSVDVMEEKEKARVINDTNNRHRDDGYVYIYILPQPI